MSDTAINILNKSETYLLETALGSRVETEGAWIKLKKPILESLSVIDVRQLEESQLFELEHAFDKLSRNAK